MPSPVFSRSFSTAHLTKRLLVLGPFLSLGLVLVVLWSLVGWFAVIYPRSLIQEVQDELQNSAENAAGETGGLLREAESSLRTLDLLLLTRRTKDQGQDATVSLLTDTLRESSRGMTDLMLANTDGRLWRIPSGSTPFTSLGPNSFLRELRDKGAPPVIVGAPLSLRPGGRLVLPLTIRLSGDNGMFEAAVAFIDLESLLRLYRARQQRPGMALFLEREDGTALARVPELPDLLGRKVLEARPERRLSASAPAAGQFETGDASLDGQDRIVAYRTLKNYPLRVFVSLTEDRVLAGYLAQRRAVLAFSLLVSLAAVGLMIWLTRVQHRNQLAEAEREATADASPMGLFRAALDGRTVYANETYLQLLELDRAQLTWGWLDRLPEDQRDAARQDWMASVRDGHAMDRLIHLTRADCTEMVLAMRTRPMRLNGRIVAYAGTLLDVTEPVRQQEAARMLSAIIDSSPDYIVQTLADGQIVYLNPAVRQRLGMADDAPLNDLHQSQFFVQGGHEQYHREILPAVMRDGHWHGRWAVRTRSGPHLPVDCTLILHRDEHQTVRNFSWMLRDISAELAVERERERTQAVMSAVARSSAVEMFAVDTDERVLFCNRTLEQRLGLASRAWEGRAAEQVLDSTLYAVLHPLIQRALAGESSVVEWRDEETPNRDAPRYLELSYAPLLGENGTPIGAYGVGRDVTDIKQEQIRLLKASNTDTLTELLNRAGFSSHVETALQRARDRGELVALLYLDLDRFKPVNDEYGHPVGDALLKAVAGRLRHALRPQDLVARLGGDEFAVFLHHVAKPDDAQVVAEKLVHALSMPFRIGALELHIGTSVGFCVQWARQVEINALVTQADAQLYHAKRAGRGQARGSVCSLSAEPKAPAV
jgi:diguanylate cyclase (GGDEF)-like protein/PAS domain S-box-containing protein